MLSLWIKALDKKSSDRTEAEIDEICVSLRAFRLFQRLHPLVLRKLCKEAYIEFLDKGVFLFKQGDEALNWYAVICGSLDVQVSHTGKAKDTVTVCTLGVGTAFGDSVLTGKAHSVSVFTNEKCTLLRVRRETFRELWAQNVQLLGHVVSPMCDLQVSIEQATNIHKSNAGAFFPDDNNNQLMSNLVSDNQLSSIFNNDPSIVNPSTSGSTAIIASSNSNNTFNQWNNACLSNAGVSSGNYLPNTAGPAAHNPAARPHSNPLTQGGRSSAEPTDSSSSSSSTAINALQRRNSICAVNGELRLNPNAQQVRQQVYKVPQMDSYTESGSPHPSPSPTFGSRPLSHRHSLAFDRSSPSMRAFRSRNELSRSFSRKLSLHRTPSNENVPLSNLNAIPNSSSMTPTQSSESRHSTPDPHWNPCFENRDSPTSLSIASNSEQPLTISRSPLPPSHPVRQNSLVRTHHPFGQSISYPSNQQHSYPQQGNRSTDYNKPNLIRQESAAFMTEFLTNASQQPFLQRTDSVQDTSMTTTTTTTAAAETPTGEIYENRSGMNVSVLRAGKVMRSLISCTAPHLLKDRKLPNGQGPTVACCSLVGSEMVDWMLACSSGTAARLHSRFQAAAMLQVLLEEGVLVRLDQPTVHAQFEDKYVFYKFCFDFGVNRANSDAFVEYGPFAAAIMGESMSASNIHGPPWSGEDAPEKPKLRFLEKPSSKEETGSNSLAGSGGEATPLSPPEAPMFGKPTSNVTNINARRSGLRRQSSEGGAPESSMLTAGTAGLLASLTGGVGKIAGKMSGNSTTNAMPGTLMTNTNMNLTGEIRYSGMIGTEATMPGAYGASSIMSGGPVYPTGVADTAQIGTSGVGAKTTTFGSSKLEGEWMHCLQLLGSLSSGAMFRLILKKAPEQRTPDEIDLVYTQLMHVKALSSLSNSIRQELARVMQFEAHRKSGSIVFNQGDPGTCWYIILRGSVNVVILGKGVVCTLNDGDDFGKLAIVNETSRAATIVTNEDNCQFLKVQKQHYDKIMRNAEANTVRLTEHGNEVLVLQKMASKCLEETRAKVLESKQPQPQPQTQQPQPQQAPAKPYFKYMVMAGTPDKIVEYLLETRIDLTLSPELLLENQSTSKNTELLMSNGGLLYNVFDSTLSSSDTFLEDFLLTYQIYLSNYTLCKYLLKYYKIDQLPGNNSHNRQAGCSSGTTTGTPSTVTGSTILKSESGIDCALSHKRKTLRFTCAWLQVAKDPFFVDPNIAAYLEELKQLLQMEQTIYGDQLDEERRMLANVIDCKITYEQEMLNRGVKKWKSDTPGPIRRLSINGVTCNLINTKLSSTTLSGSSAMSSSNNTSGIGSGSLIIANAISSGNADASGSGGSGGATPTSAGIHSGVLGSMLSGSGNSTMMSSFGTGSSSTGTSSLAKGAALFSSITGLNSRHNSLVNLATAMGSPTSSSKEQTQSTTTPESEFFLVNRRVNVIRAKDEMISRVYCADHTYTTLKLPVDSTAQTIKMQAAEKLNLTRAQLSRNQQDNVDGRPDSADQFRPSRTLENEGELVLVEMKSTGERIPFKDSEVSIQTGLSVNGRIFVSLIDHLDALTPLNEQMGPTSSSFHLLEQFGSQEIAYYLTFYSWSLFQNVHEYELIYQVFGRHNFTHITANLDVFLKHFNEIQFWVVTEICLQTNLSKRVQLLRKFIKVAGICKDFQNLNTFFAITMGLSNIAVSRLSQTWEKLPAKLKRTFTQYESLIDPSRNHRKFRVYLSKLDAPIIPFTPLLLKDMTFAHEGNLTFIGKGMINFEKMHMVAQTLRVIKFCRSKPLNLEKITISGSSTQNNALTQQRKNNLIKIDAYIRDLKVIDNQRILNQLSHRLEHRK